MPSTTTTVEIINNERGTKHEEEFKRIPKPGEHIELYGCRFVVEGSNAVHRRENAGENASMERIVELHVRYA